VQVAQIGGETPIVDCRKGYEKMDLKILHSFERKGIMYVRNFTGDLDVRWQDFFKTDDRAEVERYCKSAGIDPEWKEADRLKIRYIATAVTTHRKTGATVWFNQLQLWHPAYLDPATRESLVSIFSQDELPRSCFYGDGSVIEDSVLCRIDEVYRETSISFPWQ